MSDDFTNDELAYLISICVWAAMYCYDTGDQDEHSKCIDMSVRCRKMLFNKGRLSRKILGNGSCLENSTM